MKLSLLPYAAVAALSGLVQAAPSPGRLSVPLREDRAAAVAENRTEADDGVAFLLNKRGNKCGHSSFEDRGSEASPYASDCEMLAHNIASGGDWTVTHGVHRTLAQYGTCAFGAEGGGPWYTWVGNEDIRDLIRDSINKFKRPDGKVGSRGWMKCSGNSGGGRILWGIYHT
ncbi:hypothetical protein L249_1735 [Ophiocordyceps polyrhachis-furcata BCC 54312]|uniref:Ecp2 effector protein-like domain-containing protein n=1 Tax=Ophiocordyceps polyrhachis-furcata BCC 54312 TaxID=1330021 RepID=A0A367LPW2_9HYPO|nr:hypothetical protein L249_1735 [Ophiocordyceps polyrhachis-furcata BCC 54312]